MQIHIKGETVIDAHGLRAFKTKHQCVRRLKRSFAPTFYGTRIWESSWLLIDYIKCLNFPSGLNIMDIGCGWGLAGIYCAKTYRAAVLCVDIDTHVFPFLRAIAEENQVRVKTREMSIEKLSVELLSDIDVIIGADICFWDEMSDVIYNMINLAKEAGVRMIILADPGRTSFLRLEDLLKNISDQKGHSWMIERPVAFKGRIIKIGKNFY